jgi:hypothetical protein
MVTLNTTKNVASKVFTFGNLSPTTTKDNNDGNESFASNQTKGGSLATRITLLITKILCSNQQEDDVQELEGLLKELNGIKTLALKHSCCLKTRNLLAEKAPSEQSLSEKVSQAQKLGTPFRSQKLLRGPQECQPLTNMIQSMLSELDILKAEREEELDDL